MPGSWWVRHDFLGLSPSAQRVLLLLWTAPETRLCGIAVNSPAGVAERLRLSAGTVRSALVELEQADFLTLDQEAPLIWLHTFIECQLGGMPAANPKKWMPATRTAIRGFPQTAMLRRYAAHYGISDEGIDSPSIDPQYPIHRYGIDRPSIPAATRNAVHRVLPRAETDPDPVTPPAVFGVGHA